jgi:hypothetical protein
MLCVTVVSQLKKKLLTLTDIPKNGLVYFNGFYTDEDGVEHHYAHTLEAFRPIKSGIFLANYRFHTVSLSHTLSLLSLRGLRVCSLLRRSPFVSFSMRRPATRSASSCSTTLACCSRR